MFDPLSAGLGATLALVFREWVEHRLRIKEKRANCHHDFYEVSTDMHGLEHFRTLICRRCGYQEPKKEKQQ